MCTYFTDIMCSSSFSADVNLEIKSQEMMFCIIYKGKERNGRDGGLSNE